MSTTAITTPTKDLSGINGRVRIVKGATDTYFKVEQFTVNYEQDQESVAHSEAGGWDVPINNLRRITGQLTFVYDVANSALVSPLNLTDGLDATLHLIADGQVGSNLPSDYTAAAHDWHGNAKMKNFNWKSGPKAGTNEVTCDFTSSGPWTIPTV